MITREQVNVIELNLDRIWSIKHSYAALINYMDQVDGIEYIAGGSARKVYKLNNDVVIKVAKNKKGSAQNEAEADWGISTYGMAADWYKVSDHDSIWIESEYCTKITPTEFKRRLGISFKYYCDCIRYTVKERSSKYLRFACLAEPENYDSIYEREDLLGYMYNYIGDFDPPDGDLCRISSYGLNHKGEIVLVDTGLTANVYDAFYSRK